MWFTAFQRAKPIDSIGLCILAKSTVGMREDAGTRVLEWMRKEVDMSGPGRLVKVAVADSNQQP